MLAALPRTWPSGNINEKSTIIYGTAAAVVVVSVAAAVLSFRAVMTLCTLRHVK